MPTYHLPAREDYNGNLNYTYSTGDLFCAIFLIIGLKIAQVRFQDVTPAVRKQPTGILAVR